MKEKVTRTEKICEGCGILMRLRPCDVRKNIRCCSYECKGKMSRGKLSGSNNPMWKGDDIGYKAIHVWINVNFGKANMCENPECLHKSTKFEWAKIKDMAYERRRENFFMLCIQCHKRYDGWSKERSEKLSKALKGHRSWNNWETIKRVRGKFVKK